MDQRDVYKFARRCHAYGLDFEKSYSVIFNAMGDYQRYDPWLDDQTHLIEVIANRLALAHNITDTEAKRLLDGKK